MSDDVWILGTSMTPFKRYKDKQDKRAGKPKVRPSAA